jgi:hypothetical protein
MRKLGMGFFLFIFTILYANDTKRKESIGGSYDLHRP